MGRALIIGDGIAGPVAAMALRQAGVDATVYEAYERPTSEVGFFLNFASNGVDALRAIGLDLVERVDAHPIPRLVMWSGAGKRLGEVANGLTLADGTVSICVKRAELQRALREEALSRGIEFRYGKRLAAVRDEPDRVVATFADGSEESGDLLVGADGIHSPTRRSIHPASPEPSFTGLVGVGGYSRHDGLSPTVNTQHFVFGKKAFFGYLVRESGEIYWFANIGHPRTTSAELRQVTTQEWKRRLLQLFADDLPVVNEIIAASAGEIGAHPVYDIPTSPVWSSDRAVIVGDAAHATSPNAGQGASIACEDAIVLAQCVRDNPSPRAAFAAYEELRRERVEKVVAYARKLGDNKAAGPLARVVRDLLMPVALKVFANQKRHAWLYTYHIDWDAPAVAATTGTPAEQAPIS